MSASSNNKSKLNRIDRIRTIVEQDHHRIGDAEDPFLVLNLAEDLFVIQDIIYRTKPEYIVETGVAWGGSSLFYSMILDYVGGKKYIGIDTFIPNNVKIAIHSQKKLRKKIILIKGDSTSDKTIKKIKNYVKNSKKILVILDSNHTHDHVLKELNIYSKFVKDGQYLICGDTIVNDIPVQKHRPREWNKKNNPQTALDVFIKKNKNKFKVDMEIYRKLLFSNQPKGYLISN